MFCRGRNNYVNLVPGVFFPPHPERSLLRGSTFRNLGAGQRCGAGSDGPRSHIYLVFFSQFIHKSERGVFVLRRNNETGSLFKTRSLVLIRFAVKEK